MTAQLEETRRTLRTFYAMVEAMSATTLDLIPEAVASTEDEESIAAEINGLRDVARGIGDMARSVLAD